MCSGAHFQRRRSRRQPCHEMSDGTTACLRGFQVHVHGPGACSISPPPSARPPAFRWGSSPPLLYDINPPVLADNDVTRGLVFLVTLATWYQSHGTMASRFAPRSRIKNFRNPPVRVLWGPRPAGKTSSHRSASRFHTQQIPDRAERRLRHYQHRGSPALDWANAVTVTHHPPCTLLPRCPCIKPTGLRSDMCQFRPPHPPRA